MIKKIYFRSDEAYHSFWLCSNKFLDNRDRVLKMNKDIKVEKILLITWIDRGYFEL